MPTDMNFVDHSTVIPADWLNNVNNSVNVVVPGKQDALVSGTNIKTINGSTVLGPGDVAVQGTLVSGTSIKTINGSSVLGPGDIAVQSTLVSGTNIKTLNGVSLLGSGNIALSIDFHAFWYSTMSGSDLILRVPIATPMTFGANLVGSYGTATANATGSTAIDVQKNGSSVGTITYAAGSSSATFVTSAGATVSFVAGDILSLVGPASADTTLANVGIVLLATRS